MSRTRRIERRLDSEHQALKQLLGQNRFLTEQLNTLTNRVVEGEERHKHGKHDYHDIVECVEHGQITISRL